jgi:hypothetical protein
MMSSVDMFLLGIIVVVTVVGVGWFMYDSRR